MKKIFPLQLKNKQPERVLDSIKYDIRRYLKRERKKKLPEDATFWDFECRFGQDSESAEPMQSSQIITELDKAKEAEWSQCYVEIVAKASFKKKAEKVVEETTEDTDSQEQE